MTITWPTAMLPTWMQMNDFYHKDLVNGGEMKQTNPDHANLVSSKYYTDSDGVEWHYPVLDIDMPAMLIPSTTPEHYHLLIKKPLTKEQYGEFLEALRKAGIIQNGIIEFQWKQEGMTCIRLPGIKKEKNSLSSGVKIPFNDLGGTPKDITSEEDLQNIKVQVNKAMDNMHKEKMTSLANAMHQKISNDAVDSMARLKQLAELSKQTGIDIYKLCGVLEMLENPPKTIEVKSGD